MRLKRAMLVHPIQTPWGNNNILTESLSPPEGWNVSVIGNMIHLAKGNDTRTIISMAMLRWAEVMQESEIFLSGPKVPFNIDEHPDAPKNMIRVKAVIEPSTVAPVEPPKRRGRPPKKNV